MPYASQAQAGYFHTHEKQIGKKTVEEFDKATKGHHLPKKIGKRHKTVSKYTHDKLRENVQSY
jgi:hypothetical protein